MHLGEVDERKINRMSYIFFESVLASLGRKLNYDAVVNYAGNSYFEKSWEVISENNPMNIKKEDARDRSGLGNFAKGLKLSDIKIIGDPSLVTGKQKE